MKDSGDFLAPEVEQAVNEAPSPAAEAGEVKPMEMESPVKEKKPNQKKERKPKQHKVAAHPPYFQMIKDAITALDEKSGSSAQAIAKHIEAEHKSDLPANFRKILSLQLKNSTARGKLIKVKASYKLSQAGKKGKAVTTRSARANAVKPEETSTKRRRSARSKSVNQIVASEKAKAAGGRRMRKAAPATKPKQPKSIRSTVKKAKKAAAAAAV